MAVVVNIFLCSMYQGALSGVQKWLDF